MGAEVAERGDLGEGGGASDGCERGEVRVGAEDPRGDEEGDFALLGHGDGGGRLAVIVCRLAQMWRWGSVLFLRASGARKLSSDDSHPPSSVKAGKTTSMLPMSEKKSRYESPLWTLTTWSTRRAEMKSGFPFPARWRTKWSFDLGRGTNGEVCEDGGR